MVAALPASHPDVPDPIALEDLVDNTLLLPHTTPRFPGLTEIVMDACLAHGLAPPRTKGVWNLQTTLPLISAGMGVSVMPPEVRQLAQTEIITRDITPTIPRLQVEVVWNQSQQPNEAIDLFLKTLLRHATAEELAAPEY